MGHEFSGEVVELGPDCTLRKVGERVAVEPIKGCGKCPACLSGQPNICPAGYAPGLFDDNGGFAEYCVFSEEMCHVIPDTLSYEHAACAEPLAVGYHTLKPANFKAGDTVVISGAGPIGLGAIAGAKAKGAKQVIVIQRQGVRQQYAADFGADLIIDPNTEDAAAKILELTNGVGADCCVETTGSQQCFDILLKVAKRASTVCVVSMWHAPCTFDMNALVGTEIKISGSLGYNGNDYTEVLDMINSKQINCDAFVTKKVYLDDMVEEAMEVMCSPERKKHLKILVTPEKELLNR